MRPSLIAASLTLALALPAAADPATADGARDIETAIGRFLPPMPGTVSVNPQGDSYSLTLDATPWFARIPDGIGGGSMTPLRMTLTRQADDGWQVDYDQPFSLKVKVGDASGGIELDIDIDRVSGGGLYDPALPGFRRSAGSIEGVRLHERLVDGTGQTTLADYSIDRIGTETHAAPAAAGAGVDAEMVYRMEGLNEGVSVGGGPGPAMQFGLKAAWADSTAQLQGLRSAELLELVAFLVANPSPEALQSAEAEVKDLVRATLPLFDAISGDSTIHELALDIGGMPGPLTAAAATVGIEMHGAVADGLLRERLALDGLGLPAGLLPDWAAGLVPDHAGIDFSVSGYDAAAAAELILTELDFATGLSSEGEQGLIGALLPQGAVTLALHPESIRNGIYDLQMRGATSLGPVTPPVGSATVVLAGVEALLAELGKAPDDLRQGLVAPLMMARGMGRVSGEDAVTWDIELGPTGKLTVNGSDMTPLLGR